MNRTEVKLDTLTDSDWTGTKNHDSFSVLIFGNFRFAAKHAVIIWRTCLKLSRTGINHLKRSNNSIFMAHIMNLTFCHAGIVSNNGIRKFHSFCFCQNFRCQCFVFQSLFHLYQMGNFINEPHIDFRDIMNFFIRGTLANQLCNNKDTAVINNVDTL